MYKRQLLLREVTARAEGVLSEADAGRWPQQQLQGLLDYLHLELLRHIIDEEWILFRMSHHAPEVLAPLRQDHLELRGTIEELADMAGRGVDGSATELSRTTRNLLLRLDSHIRVEQDLLPITGNRARRTWPSMPDAGAGGARNN